MKFVYAVALFCLMSVQMYSQKPVLVFVEGNIGAGKSTFVKMLQRGLALHVQQDSANGDLAPVVISLEPCDEWQNVSGVNLLQAFYQDPVRYGCLFQIYASMTRVRRQQVDMARAGQLHIMERSWFSDRYCFAQMLHDSMKIDDASWIVYEQMWDWYVRNADMPVGFIYLRVSPETCFKRLKMRSRSEEVGVQLSYLEKLHECHDRLFIDKVSSPILQDVAVLVLDGELNFKENEEIQQSFIRQILDFLKINGKIDLTV